MRADPEEKNIIESGIGYFDPKQTHAWIWGGVGPCCWLPEYDDKPEILKPELCRHPELLRSCLSQTTRSPAGPGHVSVDLYKLARALLMEVGVLAENISWDTTCTCCAMENGEPLYWSYTRYVAKQQKVDGRNFSVAWLEQEHS
jgi:copper oxidase (laccase) domain-containing protein